MKRPMWFPKKIHFTKANLTFKTEKLVRGYEVPVFWLFGQLHSGFHIEYEEHLFFSSNVEIWRINGKVWADTTDRLGEKYTAQRVSRASTLDGSRSVIIDVRLASGVDVASIDADLEGLWQRERQEPKELRVDGKVWRSNLPAERR